MKIGYYMSKKDWKELFEELRNMGARLTSYPIIDEQGYFVDFQYVTFEINDTFYYMQYDNLQGVEITCYNKISPYEKQQRTYPHTIQSFDDMKDFIKHYGKLKNERPLGATYKQRIFLTSGLYTLDSNHITGKERMYKNAGFREKEILDNLKHIETIKHTKDYLVLRFTDNDGKYFDYETKTERFC